MRENIDNTKKGILNGLEEIEDINRNDKINSNSDIDSNSNITIEKKERKTDQHIQRLFYITPELDNFLERLKKKTGRDKSEIVRLALSYLYDNIKIKE